MKRLARARIDFVPKGRPWGWYAAIAAMCLLIATLAVDSWRLNREADRLREEARDRERAAQARLPGGPELGPEQLAAREAMALALTFDWNPDFEALDELAKAGVEIRAWSIVSQGQERQIEVRARTAAAVFDAVDKLNAASPIRWYVAQVSVEATGSGRVRAVIRAQ